MRDRSDPHAAAFLELARNTVSRLAEIGPQTGPKNRLLTRAAQRRVRSTRATGPE